jgi:DNA-binding protein H-NS
MSDFVKTLLRKNSLRKQCQELSGAEIEKVIADLADILEERKAEEAAKQAEQQAKMAAIDAIRETMRSAGVDLADLMDMVEPVPKKAAVKAKYQITDAQGEVHTWSGRGRTPTVFAEYMSSKGISKDQLPSAE